MGRETQKDKRKPIKECEETIIRGMRMNIENKTAIPTVNPMKLFEKDSLKNPSTFQNTPFKNYDDLQDIAFSQIEKDDVFYNKHIVSERLQSLVGLSMSRSRSVEEEENIQRMFEFGDVKRKWEHFGKK